MLRIAENAIHGLVAADSRVNGGQTGGRIPCMLLLSLVLPAYLLAGLPASVRERILWVRPEFSKICRSVGGFDFQPCPMRLQGFFCLGERRRILDSYASLKIRTRFADRIGSSTRSPRRRSIRLRRMRQPQRTSTEQKRQPFTKRARLETPVPF